MTVTLDLLVSGTEFTHNGLWYEKGSRVWDSPTELIKKQDPTLVGIPCVECYPKLGGKIQHNFGLWVPKSVQVNVS